MGSLVLDDGEILGRVVPEDAFEDGVFAVGSVSFPNFFRGPPWRAAAGSVPDGLDIVVAFGGWASTS